MRIGQSEKKGVGVETNERKWLVDVSKERKIGIFRKTWKNKE